MKKNKQRIHNLIVNTNDNNSNNNININNEK